MKKLIITLFILLLAGTTLPHGAEAGTPAIIVVVDYGDTVYGIAARNHSSVEAIVKENGLVGYLIYPGQRLVVPQVVQKNPIGPGVYKIANGEAGLYDLSQRLGVPQLRLLQANYMQREGFFYPGKSINIPASSQSPQLKVSLPKIGQIINPKLVGGAKSIAINLSDQTLAWFEGTVMMGKVLISSGTAMHPTPVGDWRIYSKVPVQRMKGGTPGLDAYDLPNVKSVMYFTGENAIHGTWWHKNFGHPMSHGCINMDEPNAKILYDWADMGTRVRVHR